jgi:hypothetical protein
VLTGCQRQRNEGTKENLTVRRRIGLAAAGVASVTGLVLLTIGSAAGAGKDRSQEASAARAAVAAAPRPGNNGTVKIHDGADEPTPGTRNQPHVCTFHIHARGFDPAQVLTFEVLSWQPTGDRGEVLTGKITADSEGTGRAPVQGAYSLPDGHYRLVVDTGNETPTQDKHKMFWVQCTPTPVESNGARTESSPDAPTSPTTPTTPDAPTTPTSPESGQPYAAPPPAQPLAADETTEAQVAPDISAEPALAPSALAQTGLAALGPITTAGAAMLGLGLVLILVSTRRRSASR